MLLHRQYRDIVRKQYRNPKKNASEVDKRVHREFVDWFAMRVSKNAFFYISN